MAAASDVSRGSGSDFHDSGSDFCSRRVRAGPFPV